LATEDVDPEGNESIWYKGKVSAEDLVARATMSSAETLL
jgi:hypothetical protein